MNIMNNINTINTMNNMNNINTLIKTKNISKIYKNGKSLLFALKNINLKILEGDFIAIAGPSGSGKTSLLNILGALDIPSKGKIYFNDFEINNLSINEISDFRRDNIGFIFQTNNLIPVLSVKENIEFIMLLQGIDKKTRKDKVIQILKKIDLLHLINRKPKELSGGEQQRVALARAIVSEPKIILADEPTSNLDSNTALSLINLMKELNYKYKTTFVFSTHDEKILKVSNKIFYIKDGIIEKNSSDL
jgi:putative ABC transport system ATP-binding protein